MPSCSVKCCKNNTKLHKKDSGITFHQFPRESCWKDKWIQVIRLSRMEENWLPTKSSVVCSMHFEQCDFYTTKCKLRRIVKDMIPKKMLVDLVNQVKNGNADLLEFPVSETPTEPQTMLLRQIKSEPPEHIDTPDSNIDTQLTFNGHIKQEIPIQFDLYDSSTSTDSQMLLIDHIKIEEQDEPYDTPPNAITATDSQILVAGQIKIEPPEPCDIPGEIKMEPPDSCDIPGEIEPEHCDIPGKIKIEQFEPNDNSDASSLNDSQMFISKVKIEHPKVIDMVSSTPTESQRSISNEIEVKHKPNTDIPPSYDSSESHTDEKMDNNSPCNSIKDLDLDDSDTGSLFDTPEEYKLRKKVRRQMKTLEKNRKKIKVLNQKVRRLSIKNQTLKNILKNVQKQL